MCKLVGYIFLLLAWIACALSFAAPFWVKFHQSFVKQLLKHIGLPQAHTFGLLAFCSTEKCTWVWENDFRIEDQLQDFFRASQALYLIGVVLLLVVLCLAACHICCGCCRDSLSVNAVFGTIIIVGAISIAIAIGVFAGYMNKDYGVGFKDDNNHFYWAFYIGIAGCALAVVSSVFFFCSSGGYVGYQRAYIA